MNNHSLFKMRTRDQAKYDAIVDASIRLVNELGFDGISISKIAKQAKVSPATIYIYFKNKEDLFTKLYIDIRNQMSQGALVNLQEDMSVEDAFKSSWHDMFLFNLRHPDIIQYRERFEQTAMMNNIKAQDFEHYRFTLELLQRGIKEKVIKDLPLPLLTSFAFVPAITLLRFHFDGVLNMDEGTINQACEIAWESIRR